MPPPESVWWTEAGVEKAADVARMAAEAFDPHFREAWREPQIAGLLAGGDGWLLVGADEQGLVAFALCRRAADEAELLLFATRPDRRRQGLGRAMLTRVLEAGRQRGARRIFLEVRATNSAALALYQACGFRQSGLRPAYYRTVTGVSIDAVTLSLDLLAPSPVEPDGETMPSLAQPLHR